MSVCRGGPGDFEVVISVWKLRETLELLCFNSDLHNMEVPSRSQAKRDILKEGQNYDKDGLSGNIWYLMAE